MNSAKARASSSVWALALQSVMSASICASWGRPSRQGTHLPQVCEAPTWASVVCSATGHMPAGVAAMRRANSSITAAFLVSAEVFGTTESLLTNLSLDVCK